MRGEHRVALATVVRRRGSLPMARDAKLLVLAGGCVRGTIGGGCLEAEVYAIAQSLLVDAEDLGVDLTEHIQQVIDAMAQIADELGFTAS